jgi:hypothetical protein
MSYGPKSVRGMARAAIIKEKARTIKFMQAFSHE